jgi:RHS repeat-associated protein
MTYGRPDEKRADQKEQEDVPAAPSISLPKSGGAIRGIDEKFSADAATGMASISIPIPASPGRNGFGPKISLRYDSGRGNGTFGFGWSLDLPQITRRTDRGLPQYHDAQESDVFILSHAEDLVPLLNADGSRFVDVTSAPGYTIHRYLPRIEGLFARIERWTRQSDGDVHWRSLTKDNILNVYGKDSSARVADPHDPRRIFTWMICETRDDQGNAVVYQYKAEDGVGVDLTRAHERNRGAANSPDRTANRYIKHVRYGNRVPLLDEAGRRPRLLTEAQIDGAAWMFELVFDYGEHPIDAPAPNDDGPWTARFDAFSTYRQAFEVRTARLCRRVLMFHHFPEEPDVGADSLVRSIDFTYSVPEDPRVGAAVSPIYTFLTALTQAGYRRRGDGGYLKRTLPPIEYRYTQPVVQGEVHTVDTESMQNLPIGLDGETYRWIDLHGEGIPGILTEQAGAWFYKRNVSPISDRPVEFSPVEIVPIKPNVGLTDGAQFMDLATDGHPDLVVMDGPTPGLFRHDDAEGWEPFRSFTSRLNRDTGHDRNLRLMDVDGDSLIDVLITEDDAFIWHPSLAEKGFGPGRRVRKVVDPDEERGPRLLFDDAAQSVYLADMSGDGLTDLVRIRNGEVCYWPNLGYGQFGAKVTMDNSPRFDNPNQFDQGRIRLADIDGSGTADLVYLHRDGARLYFNQSGNGWSAPQVLGAFPPIDDLSAVQSVDLFANGTACLVWSSRLPGDATRQMRYVDLMGGKKPHLLVGTNNNLGAETNVEYASSAKFYLQDKHGGSPWITKLPFPVHVVERVETVDRISGNRFVTRYSYHHGFYDGVEREFRGFGRVDRVDTEELATLTAGGTDPAATNVDAATSVPPVLTKTWYHTGIFLGREHVSDFFAGLLNARDTGEYFREPGLTDEAAAALLLPDTVLPTDLSLQEEREACRALKGTVLRQEVFALDGTDRAAVPYTVVEQNLTVRRVQPLGGNRHAVFFTTPREAVTTNYERNPNDPRISHQMVLDVDDFGNLRKSLAISYGRRGRANDPELTASDRAEQGRLLITRADNRFTNADLDAVDHYRGPLAAEARAFELTGFVPEDGAARFSFEEWTRDDFALLLGGAEIPYEQAPDGVTEQQRLIEDARTLYRRDDLTGLLPLGTVEAMAIPGQSYRLALTPGVLAAAFSREAAAGAVEDLLPDPGSVLEGTGSDEGGYALIDGNWWVPSALNFFAPDADASDPARTAEAELATARQHFFLPRKVVDPFGHGTTVEYDPHDLLLARTVDALANTVSAVNDYRVLQPALVTDPNRNRNASAFDALGMTVATAVMGKEEEALGDLLEGFDPDPLPALVQAFVADPQAVAPALLGRATRRFVYDLDRFGRAAQPPLAAALKRETHFHDPGGPQSKIQIAFSYSDGFGREIQKKGQAEPGKAPLRGPPQPLPSGDVGPGDLELGPDGNPVQIETEHRWVGTGRTVFNNKGKPVKQYEPFFSSTHLYEPERELTDTGVSAIMFYDPVERVVATLQPDHSYLKVVFDAWRQANFDANDTVAPSGTETGDPRTDPDIAAFVGAYFRSQPDTWQTWYAQRVGGQLGAAEQEAAQKAAAHANTPTVGHFDSLGRAFLTIAHNRFQRAGLSIEEALRTRIDLDIEGNQRAISDAEGRIVARYDYDIIEGRLHQASMDAGERWTLTDVAGKPIRAFDSRGFRRRMIYDELRRPSGLFVTADGGERLAERIVYGEGQGDARNQRARTYRLFDAAGVVTQEAYDFKGNLLDTRRDLLPDFRNPVDWQNEPAANDGSFTSHTSYDGLNRPSSGTSPDGSVYRPTFNEANLLDKVDVNLRGAVDPTPFVVDIDYDAHGRRELITYANGAVTSYEYDPLTFRLIHLRTTREIGDDGASGQLFRDQAVVQDLRYTYDPVGNITRIEDAAVTTVFNDNQQVDALGRFTYDAVYRLIEAQGREHVAQSAFNFAPADGNFRDYPFAGIRASPNDLQSLRNYTERYEYDGVGNVLAVRHLADSGSWTRAYAYEEPSPIETGAKNNRLSQTTVGGAAGRVEPYAYDAHGNTTSMPHLQSLAWDFKDQLQQVDLGGGGFAHYVYDASGQRVRKVIESRSHTRRKERVYIGAFEVYREYDGSGSVVTLERESLHVLDGSQRIVLVETETVDGGEAMPAPASLQRYQVGNHLGSASLELAEDGRLISYEEFHPFGTSSFQAGRSAAETSLKRYRHTGKERDEENGFYYHGARYCAPWLARWVSTDPQGMVDGPNLYVYARNSPLVYADPTGTQCDPTIASCPDPDSTPTPAEEEAQASLPEDVRSLPPAASSSAATPAPAAQVAPELPPAPQFTIGPRGEHIPTADYAGGPLRPLESYTKPYARIYAEQGNYEAAELAENYLCPTCHVLFRQDPRTFNLRGYVEGYQEGYRQGAIIVLTSNPIGGSWELGVSTAQAITGESSGLHVSNLVHGDFDAGRRLSGSERAWEGGTAVVGWALLGLSARANVARPSAPEPPAPGGPRGNAYSVAYEMELDPVDLGRSRSVHFNRANAALSAAIDSDPEFAQMMEDLIPGSRQSVSSVGGRATPTDWVWHHAVESGRMQLVPISQHTPGSIFWEAFHPGGRGGYSLWAIPAGAPKN